MATRLGLACLAASLGPDESLVVFKELSKARKMFVLENELHIIYLIVPIYSAVSWPKLDWMNFLEMWEGLAEDMKRVGSIVGVEERWMIRAMRGTVRMADSEQRRALGIHQRFYTALALHDLVHEVTLSQVDRPDCIQGVSITAVRTSSCCRKIMKLSCNVANLRLLE